MITKRRKHPSKSSGKIKHDMPFPNRGTNCFKKELHIPVSLSRSNPRYCRFPSNSHHIIRLSVWSRNMFLLKCAAGLSGSSLSSSSKVVKWEHQMSWKRVGEWTASVPPGGVIRRLVRSWVAMSSRRENQFQPLIRTPHSQRTHLRDNRIIFVQHLN